MKINIRNADTNDISCLAQMNLYLIQDEGSRNPMNIAELEQRMAGWLEGGWEAKLFYSSKSADALGYAVFQIRTDEYFPAEKLVYLRQFFIARERRHQGIGKQALGKLIAQCFPPDAKVVIDVLECNPNGRKFWESVGFVPYYTSMNLKSGDFFSKLITP